MAEIIPLLHTRFFQNTSRHPDLKWEDIEVRLLAHPKKLEILQRMEDSG